MIGPAGRPGIISPLPDCSHGTESTAKSCSGSWHLPLLSSAWRCQQCARRAGRSTNGINKTYESCNEKSAAGPTEPEHGHHRYRDNPKVVQRDYSRNRRVNSSTFELQSDTHHASECGWSPLSWVVCISRAPSRGRIAWQVSAVISDSGGAEAPSAPPPQGSSVGAVGRLRGQASGAAPSRHSPPCSRC